MFKKVARAALLFCALAMLPGCQPPYEVFLFNNSGATLQVLYSASRWQDQNGQPQLNDWGRGQFSWPFLIDNGVGRKVKPGPAWEWVLDVRVGRCTLHFEAPMNDLYADERWFNFNQYHYHTAIQIEPDGRLHVITADTTDSSRPRVVDAAQFLELQPAGYPMAPLTRTCRL